MTEKKRKHTPGEAERRLMNGESIIKTVSRHADHGAFWSFQDGRVVPSDLVSRLMAAGKIEPKNDGLFGDAQTYGWVEG